MSEHESDVRVRFEKILLALDESKQSQDALRVASELARLSSGEVRILHVRLHTHAHGHRFTLEERSGAEQLVAQALRGFEAASVKASGEVVSGNAEDPATAIERVARAYDADIVVVGARGLSPLRALIEGSTTADLIHGRRWPVLAVP